ncbi:MAG TPA: glycosyltransferase family 39 protein [Planctomycetota bacterium]|nr:glycosyltransferase family 39 protein [Planctomycetota bacterium]
MLASLPSWAAHGFDRGAYAQELTEALQRALVPPPRVLLDARALFAALAYLALLWSGLLTWRLTHSRLAACIAAVALALSFEFHYHSRIWAPDAVMAQFVVLSVLCAHRYLESARMRDLIAAAVAAGLAAGTKFPGAMALAAGGVAALALQWSADSGAAKLRVLGRTAWICAIAMVAMVFVFLLTTPAVVFDTQLLLQDVQMELRHYRREGAASAHGPYAVDAGWDQLRRMAVYVAAQGLSYSICTALILFAVGILGAVHLARRDRTLAALLFAVPALYVAYFCYQRLMLVRNFQVLLPFLAIAVGLGVHALAQIRTPKLLRGGAFLAVALALGWNAQFLVRADISVAQRRSFDAPARLEEFIRASNEPLFIAPRALASLSATATAELASKIVTDPHAAERAVVLPADLTDLLAQPGFELDNLRANWPRLYQPLPAGPWDVNYAYYPTWRGDSRPLRITTEYYLAVTGAK